MTSFFKIILIVIKRCAHNYATITGGESNYSDSCYATVGGGYGNCGARVNGVRLYFNGSSEKPYWPSVSS